jgi:hypothetical protein
LEEIVVGTFLLPALLAFLHLKGYIGKDEIDQYITKLILTPYNNEKIDKENMLIGDT